MPLLQPLSLSMTLHLKMNNNEYKDYNDYELLMLVREQNDDAKDVLYSKYQHIIDITIKKYLPFALKYGIEYRDFYQEAMLAFSDAIEHFDEKKDASLGTFITICVQRRLRNIVRCGNTSKGKIDKENLSLDYTYEDKNTKFIDFIGDDNKNNPLDNIASSEYLKEIIRSCKSKLSSYEQEVFELMISEYSYQDIAEILGESPKKIDNTIQRIKRKIKDVIATLKS